MRKRVHAFIKDKLLRARDEPDPPPEVVYGIPYEAEQAGECYTSLLLTSR
jgi:hypothetical protein